LIMHNT